MRKFSRFSTLGSAVFGLFLFISSAQAGLLIEPYLGTGQVKSTYSGDIDDDDTDNFSAVGARVGFGFLGTLYAGVDYGRWAIPGSDGQDDTDLTNTALFFGVDLPILLRGWAKYYLSSGDGGDFDDSFDFKDGYAIGVGFTGLPFISLNLELVNLNYTYDSSGFKGDFATAATLFSISAPFDI